MVILERRPAMDRPEYSFEVKEDTDRHVRMIGVWRGDRVVFAMDLADGLSEADMVSLGDGLCMVHERAYIDGLKAMYDKVSKFMVATGHDLYVP